MSEPSGGTREPEPRARRDRRRTPARRRKRGLRLLANPTWQDLLSFVLSAAGVLTVAVVLVLLGWDTLRHSVYIEPISVPKELTDEGFGPDVAARRLQDAINRLSILGEHENTPPQTRQLPAPAANSGRDIDVFVIAAQRHQFIEQSELPAIVVPGFGVSLDSFATSIQSFFGRGWRQTVSGEFMIVDKQLWSVLRANHDVVFTTPKPADPEHPDELLEQAASALLDKIEPGPGAAVHNNLGNADDRDAKLDEANAAAKLDQANAEYRRAIEVDPSSGTPHFNLGNVLSDQGKPDQAIAEFRRAIKLDPDNAAWHNNLGNVLRDQGKPDEAIIEFKRATRLDPGFAAARYNLGALLRAQGKPDQALVVFHEAIAFNSHDAYPHNGIGNLLGDRGNPDQAIAEYRTAIKLDPKFALPHYNLGIVLSGQGKPDQAIAEYQTAIMLDPKDADAHLNLGIALSHQGKPNQAITEYQTAIKLDPKSANPHVGIGNVLYDQGKPDQAIAEYQTAIKLDPKDARAHYILGNVLSGQGKPDQAIAEYQTAIKLDPKDAEAHMNLGIVLNAEGKPDQAIAEYQTAIKLDPKSADAYYNLGRLLLGRVSKETPMGVRNAMLAEACQNFVTGAALAPTDLDYPVAMRSIDALLSGGNHCPPR